jgi:hypothetical protein
VLRFRWRRGYLIKTLRHAPHGSRKSKNTFPAESVFRRQELGERTQPGD